MPAPAPPPLPPPVPPPVRRHDGALDAADVARVRALAAEAAAHDGVAALGEQALLDLADAAAPVVRLTAAPGAAGAPGVAGDLALAGYAHVDLRGRPASAELVVAPGARRAGLGRALAAAVRAVAAAAGAAPAHIWAHGDLPAARALAAAVGLTPRRELWQMARDLPGPTGHTDPPVLPDGVTLRQYRPGADDAAVLRVNARAFAWHPEQGRLSAADLAARRAEPWFRAEDLVLAERAGEVVGFTWLKVEPGATDGELYVLGVDPDAQGLGLGRALTAVTLERLAGHGLRRAVLFTEADNRAAVATYRRAGFDVVRRDVQYG